MIYILVYRSFPYLSVKADKIVYASCDRQDCVEKYWQSVRKAQRKIFLYDEGSDLYATDFDSLELHDVEHYVIVPMDPNNIEQEFEE